MFFFNFYAWFLRNSYTKLIWFLLYCKVCLVCVETLKGWRMSAKSGEGILFLQTGYMEIRQKLNFCSDGHNQYKKLWDNASRPSLFFHCFSKPSKYWDETEYAASVCQDSFGESKSLLRIPENLQITVSSSNISKTHCNDQIQITISITSWFKPQDCEL